MRKKLLILVICLWLSNQIVLGKNGNKTKSVKSIEDKSNKQNGKFNGQSVRSIQDKSNTQNGKLKSGRDKRSIQESYIGNENQNGFTKYLKEENVRNFGDRNMIKDAPFWGARGRRDSSSESIEYVDTNEVGYKDNICTSCSKYIQNFLPKDTDDQQIVHRSDSDESSEYNPFWGNRGRRQEDPPFWGNRGRRGKVKWKSYDTIEDPPFWSSRGRRNDVEPFWGNRGRRDEMDPFWGNRGRRDEMEPFWGNRGKRHETEPFWGTRGRREIENPFWKNKDHNYWTGKDTTPFQSIRGRRKSALKDGIIKAINNIEYDIENLARMRKNVQSTFWNNRGRDSKLEHIFNDPLRNRVPYVIPEEIKSIPAKLNIRPSELHTINDDRMYAEEPHYIVIERSSRSSAEVDPFFISRGKKYMNLKIPNGVRDRRGVIEELVKSVRNDPYYIARGKKDSEKVKIGNFTILKQEFLKAKELICSAIDLLANKDVGHKAKRDVDDTERERRTILKKLADQLQIDPYFVSRGKKKVSVDAKEEDIEEFISHVVYMCN